MAKRRSNNEGSIYPDEKGRIRVQITAPDGSRPSKRFDNPDDAVTWKNSMLDSINKNKYVAPSKITLGEYIY
ncbi:MULTISPECIES: hypothetical protein [Sporomusa]|uniref:hypothetical protein n=1 Tax=Sporomusa TaxID=2375 RepID=UPI002CF58CDD|nr:hypothetical protein [Sporomusa sphaeroides]HML33905.1 hypothetical protein [Sporomusa sphaeroides]